MSTHGFVGDLLIRAGVVDASGLARALDVKTEAGGDLTVKDIDGDIDISNMNGEVKLEGISGSTVVNTMNGEVLPALHGAPLRAIVPGWFGMASTKWLLALRVEEQPSDNHFMVKGYRYTEKEMATIAPAIASIWRARLLAMGIDDPWVTGG